MTLVRTARPSRRLLAVAMLTLTVQSGFAVSTLHLRPNGDDRRDGASPQTAIQTLARAQEILRARASRPTEDMVILIGAGDYRGQSVVWTCTAPEHKIIFRADPAAKTRPVFRGPADSHRAFFVLRAADGKPTNLHFQNLAIVDYGSAISLEGDRESPGTFNSHNVIEGCAFHRIGNKFTRAPKDATAAVRMVNSRHNRIERCVFDRIENAPGEPINGRVDARQRLMHSIYLAHYSSGNRILGCTFGENSGDAVKIRDASNDLLIEDNTFLDRSGADAAADDWFANILAGVKSTKKSGIEFPSWGVALRRNRIGRVTYDGKPLLLYRLHFETERCPGEPRPGGWRFVEEGTTILDRAEATALRAQLTAAAP